MLACDISRRYSMGNMLIENKGKLALLTVPGSLLNILKGIEK